MPRKVTKPKRPVGNPVKPIDWNRVEKAAIAGCNGAEIAATMGIHPDTLYQRCEQEHGTNWSAWLTEKKSIGDNLLRECQFQKALEKDNTMLIWLGKHRLNQKEHDQSQDAAVAERLDKILEAMMQKKASLSSDDPI